MRTFIINLLLTCIVLGCSSRKTNNEPVKKVVDPPQIQFNAITQFSSNPSTCRSDFYYYIPVGQGEKQNFPTAFVFDPHGDGKLAIEKYTNLADSLKMILIGSNQLKNGLDYTVIQSTFNCLYKTALQNLPIDTSQILFIGFSGGGRIALQEGSQIPNAIGIISCGAGQHVSQLNRGTSFVYIAGNEDFNYVECREVVSQFPEGYNLLFLTYNGKHEWPDTTAMMEALEFCLSPTTRKNQTYTKEESILISNEKKEREKIQQNFGSQSMEWWDNYINQLTNKANKSKCAEALSSKRSLNYISMIAYMHTQRALNMENLDYTNYSLTLYKKVDPDNPDMHFFSACYQAKLQNNEQALIELEEAISKGFKNREQLESSPHFQNLRSDNRFLDLLSKL